MATDAGMPLLKHHNSREDNYEYNEDRVRKKSVVTIPPSLLGHSTDKCAGKEGLFNVRAFFFLILWYFFSGCTLFLNKYILSYMQADPTILGMYFLIICNFSIIKHFNCSLVTFLR